MLAITSSFGNIALVLMIVFAAIQVIRFRKLKRDHLSDIDKALWQLKLWTVFMGVIVFAAVLYLPRTGLYSDIALSAESREGALQDLVRYQQRMGNDLHQLREIFYIVFTLMAFYLFGAGTFLSLVWRERQTVTYANDPHTRKPLGLETD
ncbi:MAG TPA: hypothetical protein VNO50_08360 [Pyrinomonadaceae bacterium]|nr:hypothetical protein [Pyrinomonadaceae bacterium]